jgi:hypothetical protein
MANTWVEVEELLPVPVGADLHDNAGPVCVRPSSGRAREQTEPAATVRSLTVPSLTREVSEVAAVAGDGGQVAQQ